MPSEPVAAATEVTVRNSSKVPKDVVNVFVNVSPRPTGVGSVKPIVVPLTKPMLFARNVVTWSGAPDVMVVAVVTSPVSAVTVPNGTKLNWKEIASAKAGEAAIKAAQATAARSAWREFTTLMTVPHIL